MKQLPILVILIAFVLQGCNLGTSGTWKDENIDQTLKNEIATFDQKVLEAIATKNTVLIQSIMSDKLREQSGGNIHQLLEQLGSVIKNTDYQVLNQYHVKNSKAGMSNTVMSGISGQEDYVIHYKALNEEMFISAILTKKGIDKFLITNVYGKYPDGWRLNILQFGQYTLDGKTPVQLYLEAKDDFDKDFIVDAANKMFLSLQVANPANQFWKYQKEDEMRKFQEKVMAEVLKRYTFPVVMDNIETKPEIMNINPQEMKEGYFPMVAYLTQVDLKDTIQTKKENDQIHRSIGEVFKGIDKDKKYVIYKAFNEIPNGITPVPTYGFVKETE